MRNPPPPFRKENQSHFQVGGSSVDGFFFQHLGQKWQEEKGRKERHVSGYVWDGIREIDSSSVPKSGNDNEFSMSSYSRIQIHTCTAHTYTSKEKKQLNRIIMRDASDPHSINPAYSVSYLWVSFPLPLPVNKSKTNDFY